MLCDLLENWQLANEVALTRLGLYFCLCLQDSHHGRRLVLYRQRLFPGDRHLWRRHGHLGWREPGNLFQSEWTQPIGVTLIFRAVAGGQEYLLASTKVHTQTHPRRCSTSRLTKLLSWLILLSGVILLDWLFIKLFQAVTTQLSAGSLLLIHPSGLQVCLLPRGVLLSVLTRLFSSSLCRSGSVGGPWRSSPALMWVTCSERQHPTRFLEERGRSSTKTTGVWPKCGWMNLKTSSTSSLLVSWTAQRSCVCVLCGGGGVPFMDSGILQ